MRSIVLLVTLLVACYAKVITKPLSAASKSYAYAIDLDKPVSLAGFQCMKKSGYSTVFIRAYDPSGTGKFDVNAVSNIRNANQAGLVTEVFMTPQPRSTKKAGTQFMELYEGLKKAKIQVYTVWLQVTSPVHWGANVDNNISFLNDLIFMAKYYSVRIGFYTNNYDWNQITKGATVEGPLLWYWKVNGGGARGETPANFDDFRPFAKFTRPSVKQFGQTQQICGVTVNRDVYPLAKTQRSFEPKIAKSANDVVIVGKLFDGSSTGLLKAASAA